MADQTRRINIEFDAKFRGGAQVKQELRAIESVASMGGQDRMGSPFHAQAVQAYNRERVRVAMGGGYPSTPEGQMAKSVMALPKSAVVAALEAEAAQQAAAKLKIDRQTGADQQRIQRGVASSLSRSMRAMVPVADTLGLALMGVELHSSKATSALRGMSASMMGLQGIGAAVGGKTGKSLITAGVIGEIATVVATAVAIGLDAYENKQKAKEDKAGKPASQTYADYASGWEARARGWKFPWQANPEGKADNQEAMRNAAYWRKKADEEAYKEDALRAYREGKDTSADLLRKYETDKERVAREAAGLREQATKDMEAARRNRAVGWSDRAATLENQATALQRKANELLTNIRDNSKGWADWALEAVGGGDRSSRPLALAEIQGAAMRGTAVQVAVHNNPGASPREIADIISAALRAHGLN